MIFQNNKPRNLIKYGLLSLALFLLIDIGRYAIYPDVANLVVKNPTKSAFMEYRIKQWEEAGKTQTLDQQWVGLKKISPYLVKAVLISEDDKFWKHDGFDANGLESAFEKNLKSGKFAFGGSTISQQLAKNLYLSPSKNPIRKIKEAILTTRLEKNLSKRRIIEIYLNIAEWGDGIFGAEAAAKHYFGKSAKKLTVMEAAKLAAVLPNPILYNPTGNQKFVVKKAKRLYKIMQQRGIVVPEFQEVMMQQKEIVEHDESNISKTLEANVTKDEINTTQP